MAKRARMLGLLLIVSLIGVTGCGEEKDVCDPACGAGELCEAGTCVPESTGDCDPACGTGEVCRDGACVPDSTGDCDPACGSGEICRDGTCVPETTGCQPACGAGELCQNGTCIPDPAVCRPACGEGEVCEEGVCVVAPREHPTDGSSWTFLVYLMADTNLESAALYDLEEMMVVGSQPGVNVVALVDRADDYTSDGVGNLGDWTGAKRILVKQGSLEVVADDGEPNMGNPQVLSGFLTWGVQTYPADRYAVIFWDHGASWPGFGGDESHWHDVLSLAEIDAGLADARARTGVDAFALVGFDACLMANYETALAVAPHAEYLIASEELEPGHGWDYRSLSILAGDPTTPPDALARELVRGFKAQSVEAGTVTQVTLSVIDLFEMGALQSAMRATASALIEDMSRIAPVIGRARSQVLAFGANPEPSYDMHMVDLGHLLELLAQHDSGLARVRDGWLDAMDDALVVKDAGSAMTRATGLSIYFPPELGYYREAYNDVAGMNDWRGFLATFFDSGASIPAGAEVVFTDPDHIGALTTSGEDLVLSGTLPEAAVPNVAEVSLTYAIFASTGNDVYVLGKNPGAVSAGGRAEGVWDQRVLVVVQGEQQAIGYLEWDVSDGFSRAIVPLQYRTAAGEPNQSAILRWVFDDSTGELVESKYYVLTEGGIGELIPEPGNEFDALVLVVGDSATEWLPTNETPFDPNQPVDLGLATLNPGTTAYLQLDAEDFVGSSDYVYNTTSL